MKKMKTNLSVIMAVTLVGAATLFLASAQEKVADKKIKVHINAEIRDDIGMTIEDINNASRWFFSNHGVEVVDESDDDVIELHVVVGQDDADDDNDGVSDSKDSDDDGDKIEDSKESVFAVDLDKVESELMDDFEQKDKQLGVYILFYTAGKKSENVRGFSEVDSFETEEESQGLGSRLVHFQKANFSPVPTQTPPNSQIIDSVTRANVKVLGDAPAMAMGNLYLATSQALANAAHNATTAQQQKSTTAQAATTMGVAALYSIDTASVGIKDFLGALGRR